MRGRWLVVTLVVVALLAPLFAVRPQVAAAAGECSTAVEEIYFPQTKKCVSKIFYDYWVANGGLAQQGLPVSDDFTEINAADGKTYAVQYFERARFEFHPEQADPRYKVLLGLVGNEQFKAKYPQGAGAPSGGQCAAGERFFEQTKFCVPARFLAYWLANGALAQQGLPISPAFLEKNPTDGKEYLTQYFERARFEYHPENSDPKYQILLGLLGSEQYDAKYPGVSPLFADSLTDQNFGSVPLQNDDKVHARYEPNGLRATFAAPNAYYGVLYERGNDSPVSAFQRLGFKDQRIEVEFTQVAGPADATVGLYCRASTTDPNRYVYFSIGPNDGYYTIYANFGTGENDYTPIAGGSKAAPLPAAKVGNAPTKLRADCIGDTFSLYVNGQKIAEGRDSTIGSGEQVGFEASTYEAAGLDLIFRNVIAVIPKR